MGYYTSYTLHVQNITPHDFDQLMDELRKRELFGYAFNEPTAGYNDHIGAVYSECECTWYEHDDDMLAISKMFPIARFCLSGEGKYRDDLWRHFFQNGRME